MADHRVIEYVDRQPVSVQIFSHPALDGLAIRGFIASDDGTSGIEIEPIRSATIACPKCGRTSTHPADIAEGYCGNCHAWTSGPAQPVLDPLGYRSTSPAEINNSINPGAWKEVAE